ncbi:MAG: restriction endonuclease subunit S [Polyangiaceae bacterium]
MPAEIEVVPLAALVEEERGISYGIVQPGQHDSDGIPIVRVTDIRHGRVDTSSPLRVARSVEAKYGRTRLRGGELLLSLVGTVGQTAIAGPDLVGWNTARAVGVLPVRSDVDARWIHYALSSPELQATIRDWCNTTVQATLNLKDVARLPIPLPSPVDRNGVLAVLGALDDKIELNRRMNETLEAMARALFKSWFVDFDPVRAKAEGRAPFGMDAETAALFPDSFEDSELGPIPKGWRCAPLGEWATALSGATPSKSNPAFWSGVIPWISPKVMTAIHADEPDAFVTSKAVDSGLRVAPRGATLVMVRGMGLHEKVRVSQARQDVTFNQDVKALVASRVEPTILLFAMLDAQADLLQRVQSSGHGTGVLPSDILLAHKLTLPSVDEQTLMKRTLDDLNERVATSRAESRTLASIRDVLLPRLLSGEVRVKDAEKLVEAAS